MRANLLNRAVLGQWHFVARDVTNRVFSPLIERLSLIPTAGPLRAHRYALLANYRNLSSAFQWRQREARRLLHDNHGAGNPALLDTTAARPLEELNTVGGMYAPDIEDISLLISQCCVARSPSHESLP